MRLRNVALVALAVLLSGCATTSGTASSQSAPTSVPSAPSDAQSTPDSSPSTSDTTKFGSSYKWADGLSVSVSKPTLFKPSDYSVGATKGQAALQFVFTVTNGTGSNYDPTLFSATASSGGAEASEIYDSAKGMEGSPNTKVLQGKKVSFKVAFSVADPKDVTMEVSPGFEYDSGIFTG